MLIDAETVAAMQPGSVIVDLAGEQGGNCELSVPGETVMTHDVPSARPFNLERTRVHASQRYAKNVAALVVLLAPKGELNLNFGDDIINAVCVTAGGDIRHAPTRQRLGLPVAKPSTVESAR